MRTSVRSPTSAAASFSDSCKRPAAENRKPPSRWPDHDPEEQFAAPPDGKRAILNRLKSARGHLDAVIKLVEDDTYCVRVIKQFSAVRGALDRVSRIEFENHLEHCLVEQIHAGGSAAAIAEVVEILGLRTEVA